MSRSSRQTRWSRRSHLWPSRDQALNRPRCPQRRQDGSAGCRAPRPRSTGSTRGSSVDVAVIDSGVDSTHPDINVAGGYDCSGEQRGTKWTRTVMGLRVAGVHRRDRQLDRQGRSGPRGPHLGRSRCYNNSGIVTDGALLVRRRLGDSACLDDRGREHEPRRYVRTHQVTDNCGVAAKKARRRCVSTRRSAHRWRRALPMSWPPVTTRSMRATVMPASYDEVITVSAMADSDGQPGGVGPPIGNVPQHS